MHFGCMSAQHKREAVGLRVLNSVGCSSSSSSSGQWRRPSQRHIGWFCKMLASFVKQQCKRLIFGVYKGCRAFITLRVHVLK